jgi:repressor LexA
MIKVSGDSMIEAGIHTGDIVIVDKGMSAKVDNIVVAEVDREFTLKYLKKDSKGYYLHAGNSKYPDFHPREELKIFGVVVGVIRKYQK